MAIIVPILSQFNDTGIKSAVKEFKRAKGELEKFGAVGKIFDSVGRSMTKNLTVPLAAVGAGIYKATQAASSLEESISKTNAVFGENASAIQEWSRTSAQSFGQSRQQALEAAGTYGNLLQAFGLTREQATSMSMDITELASDLASFNNTSVDDALIALRSGLSGETEPLKRFGIAINDQRLKVKALELGLGDYSGKTLPVAIKSQAAFALIMQDSTLAQGDFQRTSSGLANQQRMLQAEVSNVVAEFGTAFLPVMKSLVTIIREQVIPKIKQFSDFIRNLRPETLELILKIGGLVAALGPMLVIIGKLIIGTAQFIKVMKALGLAMAANPIGFILTSLALLVTAFVTAYKTSETFRSKVNGAINALITVFENLSNGFRAAYNELVPIFNKVLGFLKRFNPEIELLAEVGEVSFGRLSTAVTVIQQDIRGMSGYAAEMAGIASNQVAPAMEQAADATEDLGDKSDKAKKKIDKAKQALLKLKNAAKEAAQTIVSDLENSLSKAESKLSDVQDQFNNFKNAIAGNIKGVLDFGKAAESDDFITGLQDQANAATTFADKVKQLIVMGLSEQAIQHVLDAGFDAGNLIADNIILGGTDVVNQINTLVGSVQTVANEVGTFGAETFYEAGVTMAQSMVDAIRITLEAARAELAAIIASIKAMEEEDTTPKKKKGTKKSPKGKKKPTKKSNRRANGGPVSFDFPYLVGERGPEVFVPNTSGFIMPNQQISSAGGSNTFNITVNAGFGTNGAQVGQQIVEAIKKYERSSGQVFARA